MASMDEHGEQKEGRKTRDVVLMLPPSYPRPDEVFKRKRDASKAELAQLA